MYLNELNIKNFRSIHDITLTFSKGINILIGENNAGKSTIIDALRICLGYKSQDGLKVSKNDFYISSKSKDLETIEFNLSFKTTEDIEKAYFIELYDAEKNTLDLHFRFSIKKYSKYERIYGEVWGGKNETATIPSEIFHSFIQVYLGALRYLRPGRFNQLGDLISNIDEKGIDEKFNKEKMVEEFSNYMQKSLFSDFINQVKNDYIMNHLDKITFEDDILLDIYPMDYDFEEISKNLKIKIPLFDKKSNNKYLELYQNGLGHNNLIYISILLSRLSDLSKSDDSLYLALLIEEPEAHLQPQLQNLFFSYLNELNNELNELKSFQIFITSHSPTLTAKANLNSLIILQKDIINENVVCENFNSLSFDEENKEYLHKFLDVTKSQLLFSKKIIFVEGISEALLIPIFAEKLGYSLEKKRVEIVMLNGINFKHFIPLFDENNSLIFKGAIITDKDRKKIDDGESDTFKKLKKMQNINLIVCGANVTFEYDLITCNESDSFIRKIFNEIHPRIFENVFNSDDEEIFKIMKNSNASIKKSRIAWIIANELNNDKSIEYNVPEYIKNALDFICNN